MNSQLAPIGPNSLIPAERELETMLRLAEQFVKSGLMPSAVKTAAAAFTIIQTGRELGIPPMAAIRGIAVIDGKPSVSADLMAAMIQREHGGNALRFVVEECDDQRATLLYKRREWSKPDRFVYTIEDATKAGLANKRNWQTYRAAMLRARALSAVAKMTFNDVCNGLYLPEELNPDLEVDEDGAVIEVPSEPVRLHRVEGGDVDVTTGEFRPVPDDARETPPAPPQPSTAASEPAQVTDYRKRLYTNSRGLGHDTIKDLALFSFPGMRSTAELTEQQVDGLLNWMNGTTPANFDQVLATIDKWKGEGNWPPDAPEDDPNQTEDGPLLSYKAFYQRVAPMGLTSRKDVEAYLGESVIDKNPQQAWELVEMRRRDLAELNEAGR